jgi:hypothetical protein
MATENGGLVTIRIVGLPMAVYQRSSEHGDELMREFALIAGSTRNAEDAGVPGRLTAVVAEMRDRFSGFTVRPEVALAEAAARGDETIDLEYTVPPDVAQAAIDLGALLDEADEFCRAGELLTLASPPEAIAFRRWFLDEFARQVAGGEPVPWSDWKP